MSNESSADPQASTRRPVALVTGVGRTRGIGAGIARRLAAGWDVAFTYWSPYDAKMSWGGEADATATIESMIRHEGADTVAIEADLAEPDSATLVFDRVNEALGSVQALIMCHCESVATGLLNSTVESFDRHFAVNARAAWLLIREFGERCQGDDPRRRIIALTSDHYVGHVPYGASKGALDRITLAAAHEFAYLGVRANVVNPGAVDTGWMSDEQRVSGASQTPLRRNGSPDDTADFVRFLCSAEGGWINGQLLKSNGGYS
jgi:3-oxoacyl-[acyl-carrier protein] reductase